MKRIRLWIREFSLTQQLLSLIFFVVSLFSIFFYVFLSNNVNNFVNSELFKLLKNSQNNILHYIDNDLPLGSLKEINDTNIVHVVYDNKTSTYTILGNQTISNETLNTIMDSVSFYDESNVEYVYETSEGATLYAIVPANDKTLLISVLNDAYRSEFKSALTNSVININVLVVSVLFVILTLWVSTLIHPLNLIKNYIEKIKKDEAASLNIDRRDEIGEVANALVSMQSEITKQNQIKEEMIQNISHDLKTPIATIKSYGESINDGVYPYGTLEKSVDVIIEHADRLEKKVYSLIVLNKLGYLLDNIEPGNNLYMPDVIDKAIVSMKVIKPKIKIIRNIEEVYFHGEEEPWRIVIENLMDNALRYVKSYIQIDLKPGELSITNDGPNISEDVIEKLFKPYEKGTDGRFGLGLSIVQRVCNTYGYQVSVENLNDGVTFRIYNHESRNINNLLADDEAQVAEISEKKKS